MKKGEPIRAIDRKRLQRKIGELEQESQQQIDKLIQKMLDLS